MHGSANRGWPPAAGRGLSLIGLWWALAAGAGLLWAGEQGGRAEYVGGTLAGLAGRVEGLIITTDDRVLVFRNKKAAVEIPYERINLLEYGQRVSRRYALGVVVSPLLLLSKKRRHYLTIGYRDEADRQQALVFQVDKDDIRAVLAALEARTGRRVEYQDEEARKAGRG
jgi:hypothetical protein